jgi:arylsulfatase A-like enzyme
MVGELVDLLRAKGRYDETLIAVLGDHGLRARREYPPFHAGTIDDVVFHVPMVLHAPGVLTSTVRIPWMTSHIDIAPSILDLLGIEADRGLELGSPMWNPRLTDRATYFFARGYLGADGYQRNRQAVMVRYLYGHVSRSDWNGALSFDAADLVQRPDAALQREVDDLVMISAIQTELARTMLPNVGRLARRNVERLGSAGTVRLPDDRTAPRPANPPH